MGRTNYNISRASYVVDLESLDLSAGYFVNWDEVSNTDSEDNKEIKAGTIVANKGGGVVPRKDAEVTLTNATEDGGTATYTSDDEHGYEEGDIITIEGFSQSDYNVEDVAVANVVDANNFEIDGIQNAPADDGGGGSSYSKAMGILFEGINEAEKSRAKNGQSVLKGGVLYDSLLPDSGETDFETWKTELNNDLPRGFQWETYADNRS